MAKLKGPQIKAGVKLFIQQRKRRCLYGLSYISERGPRQDTKPYLYIDYEERKDRKYGYERTRYNS